MYFIYIIPRKRSFVNRKRPSARVQIQKCNIFGRPTREKCVFFAIWLTLVVFYGKMVHIPSPRNAHIESKKDVIMRIVIKIGTSTLAHATGHLNIRRTEELCKVICDIKNRGHEIILVSSGAIGMGIGKLGLGERPRDIATKQAAAAVGQCELMYTYDRLFGAYNRTVAQILLTGADLANAERHENFSNTLDRLLSLDVLPIINENDTIATQEIKVGDNDTLAALVAVSIQADLLILLSDIDGLYSADPHKDPDAALIPLVDRVDEGVFALAGGSVGSLGTGGMITKLTAAKRCTENGCDMIIANGTQPDILYRILDGEDARFTKFTANKREKSI